MAILWCKVPLVSPHPMTCLCTWTPSVYSPDIPLPWYEVFSDSSRKLQQVCFSILALFLQYNRLLFSVRNEHSNTYLFTRVHIGVYIHMYASIGKTERSIKEDKAVKLEVKNLYLSECDKCQNNKPLRGTNSLLEHSCLPGRVWGTEQKSPVLLFGWTSLVI